MEGMTMLDRYNCILMLRNKGKSYREIGRLFGISHARVEQIVNRTPKYILEGRHTAKKGKGER